MTATTVFDDLRDALAELEFDGAAVGIDLGTTKSCIAVARFEDGESRVRVPDHRRAWAARGPDRCALGGGGEGRRGHRRSCRQATGAHAALLPAQGIVLRDQERDRPAAHLCARPGRIPVGHRDCRSHHPVPDGSIRARQRAGRGAAGDHGAGVVPWRAATATLEAADAAFDGCQEVRLLDEPYAAVLDLLHRDPGKAGEHLAAGATWLVFDFGGGTCDVALFTLQASADRGVGAASAGDQSLPPHRRRRHRPRHRSWPSDSEPAGALSAGAHGGDVRRQAPPFRARAAAGRRAVEAGLVPTHASAT